MPGNLSQEQLGFYNDNGYLVLDAQEHNLFANPAELKVWAEQVRNWPVEKGKWMAYFEITSSGSKQLMRTENFVDYHDEWSSLLHGSKLGNILKQLSGEVGHRSRMCGCTGKLSNNTELNQGNASFQRQDQLQASEWKWIPRACGLPCI